MAYRPFLTPSQCVTDALPVHGCAPTAPRVVHLRRAVADNGWPVVGDATAPPKSQEVSKPEPVSEVTQDSFLWTLANDATAFTLPTFGLEGEKEVNFEEVKIEEAVVECQEVEVSSEAPKTQESLEDACPIPELSVDHVHDSLPYPVQVSEDQDGGQTDVWQNGGQAEVWQNGGQVPVWQNGGEAKVVYQDGENLFVLPSDSFSSYHQSQCNLILDHPHFMPFVPQHPYQQLYLGPHQQVDLLDQYGEEKLSLQSHEESLSHPLLQDALGPQAQHQALHLHLQQQQELDLIDVYDVVQEHQAKDAREIQMLAEQFKQTVEQESIKLLPEETSPDDDSGLVLEAVTEVTDDPFLQNVDFSLFDDSLYQKCLTPADTGISALRDEIDETMIEVTAKMEPDDFKVELIKYTSVIQDRLKKKRRQLQNRAAASTSRKRRRDGIGDLKQQNLALQQEQEQLIKEAASLDKELAECQERKRVLPPSLQALVDAAVN